MDEHVHLTPHREQPLSQLRAVYSNHPHLKIRKKELAFQKLHRTAMVTLYTTLPLLSPVQSTPVTGWNVFWAVLSLTLACATHPIYSPGRHPQKFRHIEGVNSFGIAWDTLGLIFDVGKRFRENRGRLILACAVVSDDRRRRNGDPALQDRRIRIIFAIVFILQYIKLCGYHGIVLLFPYLTLSFGSWALMELIFLLGSFHDSASLEQQRFPASAAEKDFSVGYKVVLFSLLPLIWIVTVHFVECLMNDLETPDHLSLLLGPLLRFVGQYEWAEHFEVSLGVFTFAFMLSLIFPAIIGGTFYSFGILPFRTWVSRRMPPSPVMSFSLPTSAWTCVTTGIGILDLGALAFYCSTMYDSEGTSKSWWTDYLP